MKIARMLSAAAIPLMAVLMLGAPAGAATVSAQAPVAAHALADTNPPITPAPDGDTSPDIPLQMCLASGTACARDKDNSDTPNGFVIEGTEITGPAENARFVSDGNHYSFQGMSFPTGTLHFTAHPGLCMGTSGTRPVDTVERTQACNGGTGIIVLHGRANGADIWLVRLVLQNNCCDPWVIAGLNSNQDSLLVVDYNNAGSDWFKRWEFR
jgi:hypothetical protein